MEALELNHVYKAAKLLICFIDRHRGDQFVALTKKAGARGGTVIPGRSIAANKLLQMLSLADIDQDVVVTIMGQETDQVMAAIESGRGPDHKKIGGLAILLDVSGMLFRVPGLDCPENSEGKIMSGFKLITVIVNHGYADDVMAAARKAGAQGGTIVTARGTGTEEDVKFFGISLVPEKEMLLIVAKTEAVDAILKAVEETPQIQQPGGGVVFHMNIERFQPLGQK